MASTETKAAPSTSPISTEDRYDFDKCTIKMVILWRPVPGEGEPRQIIACVQNGIGNKDDFPIYQVFTEAEMDGPLPEPLQAMWNDLRTQLPERKRQAEERKAKSTSSSPSAGTTSQQKKHPAKTEKAVAPPPPTTNHPIAKKNLVMPNLLDGLL
jgi:hypothetical protein